MTETFYMGLDVHSKNTNYCYQTSEGKIVKEGKIDTTYEGFEKLKKKLSIPVNTKIGLESGIQASLVFGILKELELSPVVIHAFEVRRKARRQRQKTDKRDALEICEGIRRDIYDCIVYIPEVGILRIRELLSRRRHFVKISTMEINAAKFVLRQSGYVAFSRSLTTDKAWHKLLNNKELPEKVKRDISKHFQLWLISHEQITELEKELRFAVKPYSEDIKLMQTIPGVGIITASTFLSTIGTPDRFPDSNHVVSYIGLAPSMQDSGSIEKHGSITKCGSKELRNMLCEVAHHAARKTHPLRPYFTKTLVKHGLKRAVVNIAHRLARILYQMWKSKKVFDVSKLNIEYVTKEKKETLYIIKKC